MHKNSGGDVSLFLVFETHRIQETYRKNKYMIDKKALTEFIEDKLKGTDYFPVEVKVSKDNEIKVEIDSTGNADIDFCIGLSRQIEEAFPRDNEDYELEVGSAGLTSPFKVKRQFTKNIGNEVEVLAKNGKKYTGELLEVNDNDFKIVTIVKVKEEGKKKAVATPTEMIFTYDDVNSVKYLLKF